MRARTIPVDYAPTPPTYTPWNRRSTPSSTASPPRSTTTAFYSTLTNTFLDTAELDGGYWYRNLSSPVLFEPAVRSLLDAEHSVFVEVSPHPVLTTALQDTADTTDTTALVTGTLRRDEGTLTRFHRSLAHLHVHGVPRRLDTGRPPTWRTLRTICPPTRSSTGVTGWRTRQPTATRRASGCTPPQHPPC
ncbi:acyltransferase domain-containing protein [Streptomyces sp. SID7803]|nr:acyltransferase domain-containing protein [Streptomyces sp. SID7803]